MCSSSGGQRCNRVNLTLNRMRIEKPNIKHRIAGKMNLLNKRHEKRRINATSGKNAAAAAVRSSKFRSTEKSNCDNGRNRHTPWTGYMKSVKVYACEQNQNRQRQWRKHRKQSQNRNGIEIAPCVCSSLSGNPMKIRNSFSIYLRLCAENIKQHAMLQFVYVLKTRHETNRSDEEKKKRSQKEKLTKRKNICSEMENLYAMSGKRIRKRHAQQVPTRAPPPALTQVQNSRRQPQQWYIFLCAIVSAAKHSNRTATSRQTHFTFAGAIFHAWTASCGTEASRTKETSSHD